MDYSNDRRGRRLRSFNPLGPALLALFVAATVAITDALIGSPKFNRSPSPLHDAWLTFILVFASLFFALYVLQLWRRRPLVSQTHDLLICTACFEVYVKAEVDRCPCGGLLEDANLWTRNRCPACGYDLRETTSKCPECGTAIGY